VERGDVRHGEHRTQCGEDRHPSEIWVGLGDDTSMDESPDSKSSQTHRHSRAYTNARLNTSGVKCGGRGEKNLRNCIVRIKLRSKLALDDSTSAFGIPSL